METRPRAEGKRASVRMAEVLGAFSLATDLAAGEPLGHALRATVVGMRIAEVLGLSPEDQADLFYASLLRHAGCPASITPLGVALQSDEMAARHDFALRDHDNPRQMLAWVLRHAAPDAPLPVRLSRALDVLAHNTEDYRESVGALCEVGSRIAQRLGLSQGVQEALLNMYESWDGRGPHGLRGGLIPLPARVARLAAEADTFYAAQGRGAAEETARTGKGKAYEPQVADAFLSLARKASFWDEIGQEDLWDAVLGLEPESPHRYAGEERLDDVALAFADFADMKSAASLAHSRGTARVAEAIAHRMGLPSPEIAAIRRAALAHDLGQVAVPSIVLAKQGPLTESERERVRLHPYYTERILSRVPALRNVAAIAGAHHEWMNGQGYYRGLAGAQIPLGARIVAVADVFQELCHRPGMGPEEVLEVMRRDVGPRLDPEPFQALVQELGLAPPAGTVRREWPAGLTDREVEVLRLVAQGLRTRQIARQLSLSEKTVGHHLEHIYGKVGASTRGGAILYAMENGLVS